MSIKNELVEKIKNKYSSAKTYKVKKFKLTDEDKFLLESNTDKLVESVKKELETKINDLVERINEINANKSENKEIAATKKNMVNKLRKFRKDLNDESAIKKRVDLLKLKKRKLKSINNKVEEKLEKLKKHKVRCFKCRKRGHNVAECQFEEVITEDNKQKDSSNQVVLCYNCGSADHNIYGCNKKLDYANLPFAECFVCKQKGHISSMCPINKNGIYIKGGSCFVCGKKDHLAKNCPDKQLQFAEQTPIQKEPVNKIDKSKLLNKKRHGDDIKLNKNKK